jgi:HAD superfamily hydrolase (TIGR01509 family)
MRPVLLLDCDGVLAETEADGHLPSFNQAFAELGIGVVWEEPRYRELLRIAGGKERLRTLFDDPAVGTGALPADPDDQGRQIRHLHARKTEIFIERVAAGLVPPRPGVKRLIDAALEDGWSVGIASTSTEASVRAVLGSVLDADRAARVHVFAGDVVAAKKPAPDIYLLALERLGSGPASTIVIEDSSHGAEAAWAAGLAHLVTVSRFTAAERFPHAAVVVSHLGDPDVPLEVLSSRLDHDPVDQVELHDLRACIRAGSRAPVA